MALVFIYGNVRRDDTIRPGEFSPFVTGNSSPDYRMGDDNFVFGGGGNDVISAGGGNDDVFGGDGDDLLEGDAGRDILRGGRGRDTLRGGSGDDYLYAEGPLVAGEVFDGGAGFDRAFGQDLFGPSDTVDLGAVTFTGIEHLVTGGTTVLTGAQFDEIRQFVFRASGIVTLRLTDAGLRDASGKIFEALGAPFRTRIEGSAGHDTILGGFAEDLVGGGGGDLLLAATGNGRLDGGGGDDTLGGGGDDDLLIGGAGRDTAQFAGLARDFAVVTDGSLTTVRDLRHNSPLGTDTLDGIEEIRFLGGDPTRGTDGDDILFGTDAGGVLAGRSGNDWLRGGDGADRLIGGRGNDTLEGNLGADLLRGGGGLDVLTGGGGLDRFVLDQDAIGPAATSQVTITDFQRLLNNFRPYEQINLRRIDADAGTPGDQAFRFVGQAAFGGSAGELRWQRLGPGRLIEGDTDGDGIADLTVVLSSVGAYDLPKADWFVA